MFYPCEGYRSVAPLDAARVNRTILFVRVRKSLKGMCNDRDTIATPRAHATHSLSLLKRCCVDTNSVSEARYEHLLYYSGVLILEK